MDLPHSTTIHRTYQVRGYASANGYARVREVLRICQQLYNRALAERRAVYRLTGKSVSKYAHMKWLTALRRGSQRLRDIDVNVERGALVRLDRAYQAFFRRFKAGEGFGFPRFKPAQRYTCLEVAQVRPGMVKGNKIKIKGLPVIRIKPSRPLPDAELKSIRLVMHGKVLRVDLVYKEAGQPLPASEHAVGIDMGVNQRMTFSTGETVTRRTPDRARERRFRRAISRKQKGSNSRRKAVETLARHKRKEAVRNRNDCHVITSALVARYGLIVIERLRINNMTASSGTRKRRLNREVLGQTWGVIRQQLSYKAEWAGRQLVEVNPAYTSRTCSECREVQPKPRVYRLFRCSGCGHVEDRDVNAARNILERGRGFAAGGATVEVSDSCRAAGNIY